MLVFIFLSYIFLTLKYNAIASKFACNIFPEKSATANGIALLSFIVPKIRNEEKKMSKNIPTLNNKLTFFRLRISSEFKEIPLAFLIKRKSFIPIINRKGIAINIPI